ncbi:hypothetical protein MFUM_450001 [Methylacidiphilum fumariolicum SolV]|uniref:Uncharacterized protein n=2 Tax=Candidatus Methylacidiphilum fumarolicum TaxID=591154 RepID=I0JY63_METFB|nr:conserved protein of unknown function [Candidatus Methylacidiphilum fumarolicum]CCG92182.1 hypothetical protein MFUM_450001 [Methylacidiphilum fumariolicum SolV]
MLGKRTSSGPVVGDRGRRRRHPITEGLQHEPTGMSVYFHLENRSLEP